MTELSEKILLHAEVSEEHTGKRLDQVLALVFPEHSRSRLKGWIETGEVKVNGISKRPRDKVSVGDKIDIRAVQVAVLDWQGEPIPLDIVYEDGSILVINKAASLVVHPGAGNPGGTLLNALIHYLPTLKQIPRAGIVHRLDKDTTGLMIVAKTLEAQTKLVGELQSRQVKRFYEAVVCGVLPAGGVVNAPIDRHPQDRVRMAIIASGKPAITHYRVIERFKAHTHLKLELETGRTHQIRVHMAYIHHPIVGDKGYGGRLRLPPDTSGSLQNYLRTFPRQALHAKKLCLLHPLTQQEMDWEIPLPEDMQTLICALRQQHTA